VAGIRPVVTKARQAMAVATVEDTQGSIEVVVFPRVYEQTAATWQEGALVLVGGRVDHRGEDAQLLADAVMEWDAAVALGPEGFGRAMAAGERGPRSSSVRPRPPGDPVAGNGSGNGQSSAADLAPPLVSPLRAGSRADAVARGIAGRATQAAVEDVAPYAGGVTTAIVEREAPSRSPDPPDPVPTWVDPPGSIAASPDRDEEPPLPEEAGRRIVDEAEAPTEPRDAAADAVLHVRFAATAGQERIVAAMETVRAVLSARPGGTRVVLHLPAAGGSGLPLELRRGVAFDSELVADVKRRLGDGVVELSLG
jgi:hypothetical protein